jgi:pyruvate,water dikinase
MRNGGKASSLIRLREGDFLTPPFFVCDNSWTEKEVLEKIDTKLSGIQYFAIRSSAENEDSEDKSFAGRFYSAIGVTKKEVFKEISKVQLSFGNMAGSVIVQEFIPSDTAGVMFSEVGEKHIIINAIAGLCIPVVNGDACDEYIFNKDGDLIDKTISLKKEAKLFKQGHLISQKISSESLEDKKIKKLICLAKNIQDFFGSPQDIEWCFLKDKLYILQSRPITQTFDIQKKEYFDSANIAESYSGIVLPLTCSFTQLVYEQVYKDLLRMSGVSMNKIREHSKVFENLLGFFYGRMYYNMNNWYRMAAFVPGYKRNKANFELMITSNVKQNIVTSISPSLGLKIFYPFIVLIKVCLFGLISCYFKFTVKNELRKLRAYDFTKLEYKECIKLFNKFNRKLLRRWYIAIENDFFVMTYWGVLKKLLDEELLQKLITFRSKATEQTEALMTISKTAKTIKPLWDSIQSNDLKTFNSELAKNLDTKILLESYLIKFGGRFANELKLESVGVDEDTKKLFSILMVYSNYEPKVHEPNIEISLPFFKKIFVRFILNKFKKCASRREEFRLFRSNTFAVARHIFRRMGELLVKDGALQNLDDVFYLNLNEILNPELIKNKNILELVLKRKLDYNSYKKVKPPAYFATSENALPSIQSIKSENSIAQGRPASPGIIRGKVKVFKEFSMPTKIDFDILVTSHTDPGWTSLIALSKGLIIEHGGVLSHASIVARELGIPAVIGATNAVNYFRDNQVVEINGSTGAIKVI